MADIDQGSERSGGGEGGLGWLVGQLLGIRRSFGTVSHLCGSTTVVLATWRLEDDVMLGTVGEALFVSLFPEKAELVLSWQAAFVMTVTVAVQQDSGGRVNACAKNNA